jgi:multiple sugar transport system substrate-binding protein
VGRRGLLVSSALLLAFGVGVPQRAVAQTTVQIEWATWGWAEPVFQEVAQRYIERFEAEHPDIQIEQGGVPYPRYEETMLTRLAGGAAPDMTRAADAMFFLFKDRGYLAPLDDYIDMSKYADDLVAAQQIVIDDGKNYGIIEGFYPYALIYNKGMLEAAGITAPPTTPQEFLEVAKQLTRGEEQYGYGTRHTMAEQSGWWYEMSFWITAFNATWALDGKPTVNTPEMIEAVTFFKEMYDADIFPKGVDAATYRRMFAEGKIAMQTDNQGMFEFVAQANPEIELGFAPPPFAPNPIQTIVEVVMMTIPTQSPNPQAAATFLEWWYNHMGEFGREIKSLVGSRQANAELVAELPHLQVYAETPVALNGGVLPQGFETRVPEFRQIVLERISQVLLEDRDPKEAMDEAQRELENLPPA